MTTRHATFSRGARISASALIALFALEASAMGTFAAKGGSGSIWTTHDSCATSVSQDANLYAIGDTVYLRGKNFDADSSFGWTVAGLPGGASGDPGAVVGSGSDVTDAAGSFCVAAYIVAADDWGEYTADVVQGKTSKNDNYQVETSTTETTSTETSSTTTADTTTTGTTTTDATTAHTTTTDATTTDTTSAETTTADTTTTDSTTADTTTTDTTSADTTTTDTTSAVATTTDTTSADTTTIDTTSVETTSDETTDETTSTAALITTANTTTEDASRVETTADSTTAQTSTVATTTTSDPSQEVLGVTDSGVPPASSALPSTDTLGGLSDGSISSPFRLGLAAVTGWAVLFAARRRRHSGDIA